MPNTATSIKRRGGQRLLVGFAVCCAIAVIFIALGLDNGLRVRYYQINSQKLVTGSQLRIVLLGDLHNTLYGQGQQQLIEAIRAQDPDLIVITGDMCGWGGGTDNAQILLEALAPLAPVYAVNGNHEYECGRSDEIESIYGQLGIPVLHNQWETFSADGNEIIVAGLNDPAASFYGGEAPPLDALVQTFPLVPQSDRFTLLLSHHPEFDEVYAACGFDLALSGHAHGGQVRIPGLLNGLYAPGQGFFPQRAGGLYETTRADGSLFYQVVSRGLSVHKAAPRIYNPPEICVVTVTGLS